MSRDRIQEAAILLTRHVGRRLELRSAITDSLAGHPKAQTFEPGNGTGAWCWAHARPVSVCHGEELGCDGETITANDPTGEAATSRDPAASHLAELDKLERRIIDDTDRLARICDLYLPANLPTGAERAKLATAGEPGCHWCLTQAKQWSPPMTKEPTTVANNLRAPVLNCRGHYDFIRTVGRPPSPAETQAWLRTGKWPKQKAA